MTERALLYELNFEQVEMWLADLGHPSYRAAQVFEWAYRKDARSFDDMTSLPADLRAAMAESVTLGAVEPLELAADGETEKLLLPMPAGGEVEVVAMRMDGYMSACLSSQVGCHVGCRFCATGMSGYERNLSAGEIVLQLMSLRARAGDIRNVVYMGMGEAFHNYEAVLASIERLTDKRGMGLSPGHITLSTAGVVPGILRYAKEGPRTELTVSLNASDQETRDRLMPGMARWKLDELMSACAAFSDARSGKPVTLAYVLMEGVNDSFDDVERLSELLRPFPHHLNLIPYNKVEGAVFRRPDSFRVQTFYKACRRSRLKASVRRSRGREIDAACGQLRRRESKRRG